MTEFIILTPDGPVECEVTGGPEQSLFDHVKRGVEGVFLKGVGEPKKESCLPRPIVRVTPPPVKL